MEENYNGPETAHCEEKRTGQVIKTLGQQEEVIQRLRSIVTGLEKKLEPVTGIDSEKDLREESNAPVEPMVKVAANIRNNTEQISLQIQRLTRIVGAIEI